MDGSSDKIDENEQRYAIIPRRTVRLFAESSGFDTLSKDLLSSLAIDVTYRLQEVLKVNKLHLSFERNLPVFMEIIFTDGSSIHETRTFRETYWGAF